MVELIITPQQFQEVLFEKLGRHFNEALIVFNNCGNFLAHKVTCIFKEAAEKGEEAIERVLKVLQRHYDHYLSKQPAEVRGTITVKGENGERNLSDVMLETLSEELKKLPYAA